MDFTSPLIFTVRDKLWHYPARKLRTDIPFFWVLYPWGSFSWYPFPITFREFWPAWKLGTDIPFSWVLYPWGSFPLYPLPITSQKFWPARKLRTDILFSGVLYPWGSLSLGFLSLTFPFLNIPGVFIRLVKVET